MFFWWLNPARSYSFYEYNTILGTVVSPNKILLSLGSRFYKAQKAFSLRTL